jgi:hypothetical protein
MSNIANDCATCHHTKVEPDVMPCAECNGTISHWVKAGDFIADEARIDIIGQNGNDGIHYDSVNHPPHYTQGGIECIDAIRAALTPEEFRGYIKGNVIKYIWRELHKGGDESLQKAAWYLGRLI